MLRLTLMVFVASLAWSCGLPCPPIGCTNRVEFVLPQQMRQAFDMGVGVTVTACLGTNCKTATITNNGGSSSSTDPQLVLVPATSVIALEFNDKVSGPQSVSLEVTRGATSFGREMRSDVTLTEPQPNGPNCPLCQFARVTF